MQIDTRTLPVAAATGVATFAWYAMPDAVRSRRVRTLLKGGLIAGVLGTYAAFRGPREATNGPDATDELFNAVNAEPGKMLAIGAGMATAGIGLTVLGEKTAFAWGERRRARGVRWAHAAPAVALGALAAAGTLWDPPAS